VLPLGPARSRLLELLDKNRSEEGALGARDQKKEPQIRRKSPKTVQNEFQK
jgi:hypothetical protein